MIATLVVGIAAAIGAPAFAQVTGPITAQIPFGFTVRDKSFPAGTYVLSNANDQNPNTMELRSKDGRHHILFTTEAATPRREPAKPELVFDKAGNSYFLREVISTDDSEGGTIAKSHEEARLESAGKKVEQHRISLVRAIEKAVKH
jgi:hypothetical protein